MLARLAQTVVAVVLFGAVLSGASGEPPSPGLLILRNGEVLTGQITHAEKSYLVTLPNGQIRIKQDDVELLCKNLDEGYHRKRAAIQPGNVHHHLELAQWCLRHGLTGFATVELADATTADPQHPMIRVLQHRLQMAVEPPSQPDQKKTATAGPSNDDLDRMVRSLPRGAAEIFTQSVQPLLMNHCLGSGCHSSQADTGMPLTRVSIGKATSKRATQRNLYAALRFVDRQNPMESRLLTAAAGPHGTVEHAIFNERQAVQFKRLADWVHLIGQQPMPEMPTIEAPAPAMDMLEPPPSERAPRVLSPEARRAQPLPGSTNTPSNRHSQNNAAQGSTNAPRVSSDKSADTSADPFDPEVFNRRYAPKKAPLKDASPTGEPAR